MKRISKPFSIIHELGHYYDPEFDLLKEKGLIKKDDFEKRADEYIFKFCDENLSLFEFFVIDRFITSFSKIKRIYTEEEMEEVEKEYKKYKGG